MSENSEKNILIIDDDLTVRKLLGFHLRKKEYKVFESEGSTGGSAILENERIDLVLCDVNMEGMDGFAFCQMVRQNEKHRVLPFIFVTAKSSLEDKETAMRVGGDDIVTKPFDVQELLIKVQALIRRADIYKTYAAKKNIEQSVIEETPKILLVDDDASLARLFQYNLDKAGFVCKTATSVADALPLAKSFSPDIIISDIMMPRQDGFEFRRLLLEDNELKSIPFIFLTSKGTEDDILEGYDLGITDYVLKTAGPRVVVAKVSAIIKSLGKERQKVVSELHRAADTMRIKVVPDFAPAFRGALIKHWHSPFKGIPGGDFIDYFQLDDNTMVVVLGDVMGKRWGAWYFAIAYAGYVRSAIRVALQTGTNYTPKEILQQVNSSVYQDAKISEVFATLSIVLINNLTNIISYAGAGDLPIIYKNAASGKATQISSKGMLLGFAPDGFFDDQILNMSKGDVVCMITDGLVESRNAEGVPLGTDEFISLLTAMPNDADPLDYLRDHLNEFTAGKYEDDISLITIKSN
ncbi:MAG: response regulator [Ignavibacteriales bacterium]|nr:response regulator [Ignavibacteriales bacterium]